MPRKSNTKDIPKIKWYDKEIIRGISLKKIFIGFGITGIIGVISLIYQQKAWGENKLLIKESNDIAISGNELQKKSLEQDITQNSYIEYDILLQNSKLDPPLLFIADNNINLDLTIKNLTGSNKSITNTGNTTFGINCYIYYGSQKELIKDDILIGKQSNISINLESNKLTEDTGEISIELFCDKSGIKISNGNILTLNYKKISFLGKKIYGIDMTCRKDQIDLSYIEDNISGSLYGKIETAQGFYNPNIGIRYNEKEGNRDLAEKLLDIYIKKYNYLSLKPFNIYITNNFKELNFLYNSYLICDDKNCNANNFQEVLSIYNGQTKTKAILSKSIIDRILNDGVDFVFYLPKTKSECVK